MSFSKKGILFIVLISFQYSWAQNFQFKEVAPLSPRPNNVANIKNLSRCHVEFADVNSDGFDDFYYAGWASNPYRKESALYINDGKGNFFLRPNSNFFPGEKAFTFCDIDGDSDPDLLIGTANYTGILINDGSGNFTKSLDTSLTGSNEQILSADIDSDGDLDLLITSTWTFPNINKIYTNDGLGNFTEKLGTNLKNRMKASAFLDVDQDGDVDLVSMAYYWSGLTGLKNESKIYWNDGIGNFIPDSNSVFKILEKGKLEFGDLDNDNDLDLVVYRDYPTSDMLMYINDGNGNYSELLNPNFFGVLRQGSIRVIDYDNDGDEDIVQMGKSGDQYHLYVTRNDGFPTFSKDTLITVSPVKDEGIITFSDIDQDGDPDLLVTGEISKMYENDGVGNFIRFSDHFHAISNGSSSFFDANGNGFRDVVITGSNSAELYINDSSGSFRQVQPSPFNPVSYSNSDFADINGDGNMDLLISGMDINSHAQTDLYTSDNLGNFSLVTNSNLMNLYGDLDFGDIDTDGDQDLVMLGFNDANEPKIRLYKNDGLGNFTYTPGPFGSLGLGNVQFIDVDNDTDLDLMLNGRSSNNLPECQLFLNDGSGLFTLSTQIFPKLHLASFDFADIDNDGDQDFYIRGSISGNQLNLISQMFLNDGQGVFSLDTSYRIAAMHLGSAKFSDVDQDNYPELLVMGKTRLGKISKRFYKNDSGSFRLYVDIPFEAAFNSDINFADLDNDGDEDLLITGYNDLYNIAKLYHNFDCGQAYKTDSFVACNSFKSPFNGRVFTSSGVYIDTLWNPIGCDSILTLNIQINHLNSSVMKFGSQLIAQNQNIGVSYQWLDCSNDFSPIQNENDSVFNPIQNGFYALQILDSNCVDTSACIFVGDIVQSELKTVNRLQIYPNPIQNGKFRLIHTNRIQYLEILDSRGIKIKSIHSDFDKLINVSELKSGIYIIRAFSSSGEEASQKIIIM
jgi:hypothetical protein